MRRGDNLGSTCVGSKKTAMHDMAVKVERLICLARPAASSGLSGEQRTFMGRHSTGRSPLAAGGRGWGTMVRGGEGGSRRAKLFHTRLRHGPRYVHLYEITGVP
jgi:hypothetical protein